MRNVCNNILSTDDHSNSSSDIVDANQLVSASFHVYFGDTNAAGTAIIQASNDPCDFGNIAYNFVPTNWSNIPNQSATITSGGSVLLTLSVSTYRWLKLTYTSTATGAQTVAPIADTGTKQTQSLTIVADTAGSLNNTYFLLSSVNLITKVQKNWYMWFNINSAGTDPTIAGRTGIPITGATNVSANTLATSIRSALNALTNDFTSGGSSATVTITNVAFGPVTAAVDGAVPTHFTFGAATVGVTSNLVSTFFLLSDAADVNKYLVWNNVDSIGTAPVLAGYTAAPVVFASGSSTATIGTALATAIGALNGSASFTATGTTTVTVTNKVAGPFTAITDGSSPTNFTFAITGGGTSTINCNYNALGI